MQVERKKLRGMLLAAMFAALTAAVSVIRIPIGFTPVPLTLQTVMVLVSGALLGPGLGALSQALYVLVGAVGMPVFSGGTAGFGVLLGPTGGYLVGFIAAAFVVGKISRLREKPGFLHSVAAMVAGTLTIYAFGVSWAVLSTGLPLGEILVGWVLPFIAGDAVKMLIAAFVAYKARQNLNLEKALGAA